MEPTSTSNSFPYSVKMESPLVDTVLNTSPIIPSGAKLTIQVTTFERHPRGRQEVMDTITKLNREKGITIVLITHYMDEAIAANRVVVMDKGNILMDGTPKEIFSQVDLLKEHHLDVPQSTELIHRLKEAGCMRLPNGVLTEDECVAALELLLKEKA